MTRAARPKRIPAHVAVYFLGAARITLGLAQIAAGLGSIRDGLAKLQGAMDETLRHGQRRPRAARRKR